MISSLKRAYQYLGMILVSCFITACSSVTPTNICAGDILYIGPGTNGHADVYSINPDNSEIVRWTENPGFDGYPSWSPDGQKIALISFSEGSNKLLIIDSSGSKSIGIDQDDALGGYTSWSRDGNRLAFLTITPGLLGPQAFSIGIVDLDGDTSTYRKIEIQEMHGIMPLYPQWTADPNLLAFLGLKLPQTESEDRTVTGEARSNIYVINIESEEITNITKNANSNWYFDWAFDSQELIFLEYQDDMAELYRMDLSNFSKKIKIGTNLDNDDINLQDMSGITWSPDKEKIAFWSNSRELYMMDIDGSNLTQLLDIEDILGAEKSEKTTLDWQPQACI